MRAPFALVVAAAGCAGAPDWVVIAHRAAGGPIEEENLPDNVAPLLRQGFGVELDVRGDGAAELELGHDAPNGRTLEEALALVEQDWRRSFAGGWLVIDISDDSGERVSGGLVDYLCDRAAGSALAELVYVVQSSGRDTLAAMHARRALREDCPDIRFAQTFWAVPELTVASHVDFVATDVVEVGDVPGARPLLLFGVDDMPRYSRATGTDGEVAGIIVDHPARARSFGGCR